VVSRTPAPQYRSGAERDDKRSAGPGRPGPVSFPARVWAKIAQYEASVERQVALYARAIERASGVPARGVLLCV